MRRITLTIILLISATCADAASYQKTDGTIVDPIQMEPEGDHPYSGNNLQPDADLIDADLQYAVLSGADLENADLSGSDFTNVAYYNDATWTDAFYYTDNEPTWDSGMDAAWRESVGILALGPTNAVPEPSTLLLALFGLALLPRRRRR